MSVHGGGCYRWDNIAMAPILFNHNSRIFWSFDDEKSVALKSRYVDAYNLRGIMFWELSGDDSTGSLLKAIYKRDMAPDSATLSRKENNKVTAPEEIKITSPLSPAILKKGTSVAVTTDASKYAGKIIKVEFFLDGKSIGFDAKAPHSWAWFNVQKGRHTLSAAATDINGRIINSPMVSVNVQ
jgi:hypothetical protein